MALNLKFLNQKASNLIIIKKINKFESILN